MEKPRIALTGGGTGGHIYPCLAIAEELEPNAELFYIGNSNKLESELLNSNNCKDSQDRPYKDYINFIGINAKPFINKTKILKLPIWLWEFYEEIQKTKKILSKEKISIVFGTGGYVSAPVFAAARELKIPYIIHNLDAHIGLANKLFIRDAFALTTGFENLKSKPKNGKLIITGNPISKNFRNNLNPNKINSPLNLLITGGSQGAESINTAVRNILERITKFDINIIHITGSKTYESYMQSLEKKYPNYQVVPYTHEMPQLCNWANLAICRSGAMTIAEFACSGVVPIFVPLPWAAHNHQKLNAQSLVDAGAAISLDQNNPIFENKLYTIIERFAKNPKLLQEYQAKLKSFGQADSTKSIVELILSANRCSLS